MIHRLIVVAALTVASGVELAVPEGVASANATSLQVESDTPPHPLTRIRVGLLSLEAPPGSERILAALSARAREILPQLERELGVRPTSAYRVVLIPAGRLSHPELLAMDEAVTPWAAGFMFPERRVGGIRVAEAARYPYGTLEAVLAHEVTHLLLHDALGDKLPLWFNEGASTWEGRRWNVQDLMVYTRSLLTSGLPKLEGLDPYFHGSASEASLAYAASFSFVSWNIGKHGPSLIRDVVREAKNQASFAAAWESATGQSLADAESAWRMRSLIQYRWIPVIAGSGTLWIGVTFLFLLAGMRKRRRVKEIQERWAREEQAEAEEETYIVVEPPTRTYGSVPPEPDDGEKPRTD